MHCALQTNALDDGVHNHHGVLACTSHGSDGDNDVPYGKSNKDNGSGASSNDPNRDVVLCNSKDATNLANTPNSKVNAMLPTLVPKTNHKSLVDRYIQVR